MMRDNKKNLNELICEALQQMQERKFGRKISLHYQSSFNLLTSIADDMGEDNLLEKLIKTCLGSPENCSVKWIEKEKTHRERCFRLLSSLAKTGVIDWGKEKTEGISGMLKTGAFQLELEIFYSHLKKRELRPDTVTGYKRMITYFCFSVRIMDMDVYQISKRMM